MSGESIDLSWIDHRLLKRYIQCPRTMDVRTRRAISEIVRTGVTVVYFMTFMVQPHEKNFLLLNELSAYGCRVSNPKTIGSLPNQMFEYVVRADSFTESVFGQVKDYPKHFDANNKTTLEYHLFEILNAFYMSVGWHKRCEEPFYIYDHFDPLVVQKHLLEWGYITELLPKVAIYCKLFLHLIMILYLYLPLILP